MSLLSNQLLKLYRTSKTLRLSCLQFIPSLMLAVMVAVSHRQRRVSDCCTFGFPALSIRCEFQLCADIESTLLALYNHEIVNDAGVQKVEYIRVPSLCNPSIYHDVSFVQLLKALEFHVILCYVSFYTAGQHG